MKIATHEQPTQLAGDDLRLVSHYRDRKPQHDRPVSHDVVLSQLIGLPLSSLDMVSTVDLGSQDAPVRQIPLCVEVAAAAARSDPNRLLSRLRQAVPAAQPDEVDLTKCIRALRNVTHSRQQRASMPRAWRGSERFEHIGRRQYALLYSGSHKSAC